MRALLAGLLAAVALGSWACGGEDARTEPPPVDPPRADPGEQPRGASPDMRGPGPAARERRPPAVRVAGTAPRVEVVARGLEVPWDIAFLPDGRALLTERPGRIRLVERDGRVRRRPVARVATSARGEGGLLGIAVDPAFAAGRRFAYVYVTRADGMVLLRYRWRAGRLVPDGRVLDGIAAGTIHDSGRIRFGPDRRLYVATGDAGRGQLAQDRGSLNGKMLRLHRRQYRGSTNDPEIFSLGHRNPQGLDWRPRSGRLVATEHGPSGFDGPSGDDEVNIVRRGRNYGWPRVRGRSHGRFAAPAQVYAQTIAPSGAAFVTRPGSAWTGQYVLAALRGEQLRRLRFDGARVVRDRALLRGRFGRLRAVVEAPDGSLWVTTSNRDGYGSPRDARDDRLLRIIPPRG